MITLTGCRILYGIYDGGEERLTALWRGLRVKIFWTSITTTRAIGVCVIKENYILREIERENKKRKLLIEMITSRCSFSRELYSIKMLCNSDSL